MPPKPSNSGRRRWIETGQKIPPPRSLVALKADPEIAEELARYMVALIPLPASLAQPAAE